MKKISFLLIAVLCLMASCENKEGGQAAQDQVSKVDSIQQQYNQLQQFVDIMATTMDSISMQEGYLLKGDQEGKPLTDREKIKQNLANFRDLIARQKGKIEELEKTLSATQSATAKKMQLMISAYQSQLAEKDRQIAELTQMVEDQNVDIASLKTRVARQSDRMAALEEVNLSQQDAMRQQDKQIYTCYIKIASKSQLKAEGIRTGGSLFSKGKLDVSNIDKSSFSKVDKRNFQSQVFNAKKAEVMTQHPKGSYRIDNNGDGTKTFVVLNPSEFWKTSKYLVIRAD